MKGITRHLVVAFVLAVLGGVCLAAGTFDRHVALSERNLASLRYDDPDNASTTVEQYLEYGSRLPWIGSGPLNRERARKAAMRYWQHQYDQIIPQRQDPVGAVASDNVDLQLIVANAIYRKNQTTAKDKASTLRALDAAIAAYLAVLKNGGGRVAAHNYEYTVRVRDDVDKGRHAPELTDTAEDGPGGRQGGDPPKGSNKRDIKILIPLEPGEMDKALDPGKGISIERKG